MLFDWRKWGFGFSLELRDPFFIRLWIGPLRLGWKYGHFDRFDPCPECQGSGRVLIEDASADE